MRLTPARLSGAATLLVAGALLLFPTLAAASPPVTTWSAETPAPGAVVTGGSTLVTAKVACTVSLTG